MRILFCNYEYPPLGGGGGVINALLAEELATRHEVTVLTSQGLDLPRESSEGGVRIIRVPVFFRRREAVANLASMFAYMVMGVRVGRAHLAEAKYDIINTHFVLPSGPVGDALSRLAGVPNILSVHGGDLYDPSKWTSPHRHAILRLWVRSLLKKADHIVGQSEDTLRSLRRFYVTNIPTTRIPLGIRRPASGIAARESYGLRNEDIVLVTVGRLVSRKGLDQLLTIMSRMGDNRIHLLVMGTGPEEERLRHQASALGLTQQAHFLGYVEESEKFAVLRMSDIYVSTSQHEGFGLVFLEAMACGLPIICYDRGGQTDFLETRQTGYVVPLNDMSGFEISCKELSRNPTLRQEIAEHNRQRVASYYIESCARKYEEVFDWALQKEQSRTALDQPRGKIVAR
ncbi:MAG: glycosyltransferase family 4 protein [Gammaproteobacteria bacterium]